MSEILDSGNRREFETGATRDIAIGKGRCDLLPLVEVGAMLDDTIIIGVGKYIETLQIRFLNEVLRLFVQDNYKCAYTAFLELSKHYEAGALKYSERNWEKGIPIHCFIDSAMRHYFKFKRGDEDEPHNRAFMWNIIGAIWTAKNRPEMMDIKTE